MTPEGAASKQVFEIMLIKGLEDKRNLFPCEYSSEKSCARCSRFLKTRLRGEKTSMVDKIMFRDNLSLTRKAFEIQILNFGQKGAFGWEEPQYSSAD